MIIEMPDDNSIVKWRKNENEDWKSAEISDLIKAYEEIPQHKPVIKCQDCKYRVKEWREDKRMKEKGYWAYGCEHMGDIMGYWGFGGYDNEFCSDAEEKGEADMKGGAE